jgi:hypothetical protein
MMNNRPGRRPLDQRLVQANELGIRLEIVGGLPLWEFSPARRHQQAIDRIRASIAAGVQREDSAHGNDEPAFPQSGMKTDGITRCKP